MTIDKKVSPDTNTDAESANNEEPTPKTENEDVNAIEDVEEHEVVELIDEEELEQLRQDLIDAQELAEKNQEEVLRARAEIQNLRRRMERDVENAHKFAVERFVQELIPVIDSLEMGLAAAREENADLNKLKEGTELTLKMFSDTTAKFGVDVVDPSGEEFNPEYHQAMSMQESGEVKPNTVMAVMQKGYVLKGRLIRPAMVVVSKAAPGKDNEETKSESDSSRVDVKIGTGDKDETKGTKIDEKA